ncbi:hypothetical protein ZIOFF_011633 [Zingiber officinale]|uniref:DNA/RNA-binding protein Alba-like domain-containing protein n=1 Tax=Zingiber officinale TaxID=94328 RepID=A0A8J5I8C9_ZINOF|nr:hypothetical protein ZIOFF_011633 [Zingiber officinale]
MDRYQKVEKPRPESAINENEIRITGQGVIRNYVSYATSLLQEKHIREIVLKAMGQAISKAVAIAEIIKKRMPGLYQETQISSVSITDVWEPIEEGLVPLEMVRHVSMISISLSTRELNKNSPGYQAPSHLEQPRYQQRYQQRQQSQPQQQFQSNQAQGQLNEDSYAQRGRGRGRSRGRGWGRGYGGGYGGYDNSQGRYAGYGGNNQVGYGGYGYNQGGYGGYQENGGWNSNWGRGGGRGRSNWSYRGGAYGGGDRMTGGAYGGGDRMTGGAYGGGDRMTGGAYGGDRMTGGAYGGGDRMTGGAYGGDRMPGGRAGGGRVYGKMFMLIAHYDSVILIIVEFVLVLDEEAVRNMMRMSCLSPQLMRLVGVLEKLMVGTQDMSCSSGMDLIPWRIEIPDRHHLLPWSQSWMRREVDVASPVGKPAELMEETGPLTVLLCCRSCGDIVLENNMDSGCWGRWLLMGCLSRLTTEGLITFEAITRQNGNRQARKEADLTTTGFLLPVVAVEEDEEVEAASIMLARFKKRFLFSAVLALPFPVRDFVRGGIGVGRGIGRSCRWGRDLRVCDNHHLAASSRPQPHKRIKSERRMSNVIYKSKSESLSCSFALNRNASPTSPPLHFLSTARCVFGYRNSSLDLEEEEELMELEKLSSEVEGNAYREVASEPPPPPPQRRRFRPWIKETGSGEGWAARCSRRA